MALSILSHSPAVSVPLRSLGLLTRAMDAISRDTTRLLDNLRLMIAVGSIRFTAADNATFKASLVLPVDGGPPL